MKRNLKAAKIVLIETLWNVKMYHWRKQYYCSICINRNIMECKVVIFTTSAESVLVLIETLWNVKKCGYTVYPKPYEY